MMNDHIIDCCSLLNLLNLSTGWGGLHELRDLDWTWHVCEAVFNEAEYTREYDADGKPTLIALDITPYQSSGLILPAAPETAAELDDYINFATEIDDGEAQALAIAKHRGFILLTDDNKARAVAHRPDVAVPTTSSADILRAWAQHDDANALRISAVIQRITTLARFSPRVNSADYAWWQSHLRG
jgi:hypothetical protein